jgi:O-acetyl-ADP-ribose deacetylase
MFGDTYHCGLKIIRRYNIIRQSGVRSILIAHGSVLDFKSYSGAIVNAANEGCLGGCGIDGAITNAGGAELERARLALPIVDSKGANEYPIIRCRTGDAVVTGPANFGALKVPYVIHAVGPNFWNEDEDVGTALLVSAYRASLDIAAQYDATCTVPITQIAFSLLSAGIYRGEVPLHQIFEISIDAINGWAENCSLSNVSLKEIILCAFTRNECTALMEVTDKYFSL